MKSLNRIVGTLLFLSLYISAIASFHAPINHDTQYTENSLQKKEVQITAFSSESVFSIVEVLSDNFQNSSSNGLKKYSHDQFIFEGIVFSQENSNFKQYNTTWSNQLIASKNTDQLYPHHTFG